MTKNRGYEFAWNAPRNIQARLVAGFLFFFFHTPFCGRLTTTFAREGDGFSDANASNHEFSIVCDSRTGAPGELQPTYPEKPSISRRSKSPWARPRCACTVPCC